MLSRDSVLPLRDCKTFTTRYYLNKLIVSTQRFTAAGYELVFTDRKGIRPIVDPLSVSPDYFVGSKEKVNDALKFQVSLPGLEHPLILHQVALATWIDTPPFSCRLGGARR